MVVFKRIRQLTELSSFFKESYDAIFIGAAIDDRTRAILNEIKIRSEKTPVYQISIDIESYGFYINGVKKSLRSLLTLFGDFKWLKDESKVLIESTSLDFSEILYVLQGIRAQNVNLSVYFSYLEPKDYKNRKSHLKEKEEFLLSDSRRKFLGLPGFSTNHQEGSSPYLLALLGFEGQRLGQVLEEDDKAIFKNMVALVGLPAFKPGWENRSLHRHIEHFSDGTKIHPYPSTNPYQLTKILNDFFSAYKQIVITSMGTKPAAIACAVFLINNVSQNTRHKNVGAIYDFPKKSKERSIGVGEMYMYESVVSSE
jgi:hypothetical protein